MRFLVVGAGTMGLTYAWLLSSRHQVEVLVRPQRLADHQKGYQLELQDLRDKQDKSLEFFPRCVTSIHREAGYDAILVMVNRLQLAGVLPLLRDAPAPVVLMLNHWDIDREVRQVLTPGSYLYGFPSQVGGGREGNRIEAVVFEEGTVLGEPGGAHTERLTRLAEAFRQAGLAVEVKDNILPWMKVHYLQQSITAGALAKAGDYQHFAGSYPAVREMVHAFREGVAVCKAQGLDTRRIFPASLFRLPTFFVARAMQGMFQKPETVKMVTGHQKQGMPEWVAGYREVLADGEALGVPMPVWRSYLPYVDRLGL